MKGGSGIDLSAASEIYRDRRKEKPILMQTMVATGGLTEEHLQYDTRLWGSHVLMQV